MKYIAFIIVLIVSKSVLYTQQIQNDSTTSSNEVKMDEVIIEANKTLDFSNISVIATIEQKDIQFAPINNLQDLLEYLQGVDIRSRGTEGVQADVSIRGGTFDQTIVLLNGINFTDPQTGHHSLNLPIDVSIIERIEILQGIDSWIAGVPVFCGAINIITKNPTKNVINPYFSYGMNDFYKVGFSTSAKLFSSKLSVVTNLNLTKSNGYAINTDFNILNGFVLLNFRDAKIGVFELQTGYLDKEFGANSFYSITYREQFEANKAYIASLKYNNSFNGFGQNDKINLNSSIYYRKHNDRFELFRWESPDWYTGHNFHLTDISGINASLDYSWALGYTTLGGDIRYENIKSTTLGDLLGTPIPVPNEDNIFYTKSKLRIQQDGYLKHYFSNNSFEMQFGIMASRNNNFGFKLLPSGNFRYLLNKNSNIMIGIQQGYRLPTFTDLCYDSPSQKGNINLQPEESINAEISYSWHNSDCFLKTNIFYRYGFKIIDWVHLIDETVWHAENFTDVATMGVDISAEHNFNSFIKKIKLNYLYLDVKKRLADNFVSLYATDFLKHQLNFSILHNIWKSNDLKNEISANWHFRFQSRAGNYKNENNELINYSAIFLCDLKIMWQSHYFNIYIYGTNLLDTKYVDIANLPQPGIWLKTGIDIIFPN